MGNQACFAGPAAAVTGGATSEGSGQRHKVAVCGGSGGIGQPLSLLLSMNSKVGEVSIIDIEGSMVPAKGVAADLSHLNTTVKVNGYAIDPKKPAKDQLRDALTGCSVVMIPAGIPRKPGMTRDDLFKVNAGIAKGLVEACAEHCPNAVLGMIVNPVNSVVPAMAAVYEKRGLDPMKVVGVTTLDIVRSNKFLSEKAGKNAEDVDIPVIGGHAGKTIMPVLSQSSVPCSLGDDIIKALDVRIQDAGTEVVNAKGGAGSATLSMAYAGADFANAVLNGLNGKVNDHCAYVKNDVKGTKFFSTKVTFGKKGVEKVCPIGKLTPYEEERLNSEVVPALKDEVQKGLDYANAL